MMTFNDVMVEKVIDQNSRSQTAMESVWSVSKLSTEYVGSRRELVANCVHTADADATQLDSGVYWTLSVTTTTCKCQRGGRMILSGL